MCASTRKMFQLSPESTKEHFEPGKKTLLQTLGLLMAFSNLIDVAIINENENHYVSSLPPTFLIRCPIKPFRHGRSIIGNKTTPEKSFTASTGGAQEWSRHCFQNLFHLIHHRIKSLDDETSHLQFNKRQSLTSQMEEDGKYYWTEW